MNKKNIIVLVALFVSGYSHAAVRTCELNPTDSLVNQFSLENPFTACNKELNVRGLPNIWDVAWNRLNSYGDLTGDLGNTVCESVFSAVNGAYNDIYDEIIGILPPGYEGPNDDAIDEYCQRHPAICGSDDNGGGDTTFPPSDDLCREKPWECQDPRKQQNSQFFGKENSSSDGAFFKKKEKKSKSDKKKY